MKIFRKYLHSVSEKMLQYQNTRAASLSGWLHSDKGILISTRFGETAQVHHVKSPGAARYQLTFFNEPVSGISVCPDKTKNIFFFTKDIGGGEFYQIYSFNMDNGEIKMLTDGKSRNGLTGWSKKGDKYAFTSTKRNNTDTDIYLASVGSPENPDLIVAEGGSWGVYDWSFDDMKLIVGKYISANESHLYIYDIKSRAMTEFNPSSAKIAYGSALFNYEGTGIYYTSDENSEFSTLRYFDNASGKTTILTPDINWDVQGVTLSDDGTKLAFTTNEGGIYKLYLMETETNKFEEVKNIPVGLIGGIGFNDEGTKLGFTLNTSVSPGDGYSVNLDDYSVERWTYSEIGGLNSENFITPELINYKTFDGKEIPAFYYKPKGEGPFPVLINIHGGPEGQYLPSFSSLMQYFIKEMGIAVIGPNVRGSTGYGKTYLEMDNWYKREESVQDIGALIDWIASQPELDSKKICVYGGSYGGYMVLASMTNYNDKIKCGIDVVGISNFVTFLENTQSYRRDLRRVEYGDERIPEMKEYLLKISPTTNVNKIKAPVFIVQGLNDPRVPVTEAEQILDAVKKNGIKAWYLMAKDEGHGFQKKVNRDYLNNAIVMFLEENLMK